MSEINVRADAVDVEQIMRQIRARIREKRGADYTEGEIEQLASVKLEKFLDPRGIRSDLVAQFRRHQRHALIITPSPAPPNYAFEDQTLYETHRGVLAGLRRLLRPILKLFLNPDKITAALNIQARVNTQAEQRLRTLEDQITGWVARYEDREPLFYEVIHNLTMEVTRLGIEVHNLKMRTESLSSRMDFDERRARALESVVEYRPAASPRPPAGPANPPASPPAPSSARVSSPVAASVAGPGASGGQAPAVATQGDGQAPINGEKRRRRRRRRRRPGQTMGDAQAAGPREPGQPGEAPSPPANDDSGTSDGDASDADDGADSSDSSGQ